MELLIHLTETGDMFNLADGIGSYNERLSFGLRKALEFPYLLHELLAYSARHLAYLNRERSDYYMDQAVALQTRAMSLFNSASREIDRSNCVAIVGFSSVLGHHLLADTLAKRPPGRLEGFLMQYLQCVDVQRGIYTIAMSAWPMLMESELEGVLVRSAHFTSQVGRGEHCRPLTELIEGSSTLDQSEKQACDKATRYLQIGIDALEDSQQPDQQHKMIYLWSMLMPPNFTVLLAARRPEALVILAHYTILLHHGRHLWQVGGAGSYILGLVSHDLTSEWDRWLDYPRQEISHCQGPAT